MKDFDRWLAEQNVNNPPKAEEEEMELFVCPGCDKWGKANFGDGDYLAYYCGGSPRCCP